MDAFYNEGGQQLLGSSSSGQRRTDVSSMNQRLNTLFDKYKGASFFEVLV
jgi:hypothetical protein